MLKSTHIKQWTASLKLQCQEYQKDGAKALKTLDDFTDDLIFKYEDTGKNTLLYNDAQSEIFVTDYLGNTEKIYEPSGACILPTTYVLKNSVNMMLLEIPTSAPRSIYKE